MTPMRGVGGQHDTSEGGGGGEGERGGQHDTNEGWGAGAA